LIMLEEFCSYFEGYFNNQKQAFNHPREFAMIELQHTKVSDNLFQVTQGYVMDSGNPYREVEIEVIDQPENDRILLKTYKDDARGKFGRILGELWYGKEHNINQLLVDNHHAVRYHGQSKEEIWEEHIANRKKLEEPHVATAVNALDN